MITEFSKAFIYINRNLLYTEKRGGSGSVPFFQSSDNTESPSPLKNNNKNKVVAKKKSVPQTEIK